MNTAITPQQSSVPATTRLPPDLNERVEKLVKGRGYGSKSKFLKEAARFYTDFCERVNLGEIHQQETDRFFAERAAQGFGNLPTEAPLARN
jgi:Arc/MetJ-type ribon-helix-helix transcriptional regulator